MKNEMDDVEILSELSSRRESAMSTMLEDSQAKALDYYYGRPYGNEEEGWSTVVTREVKEIIDWMMPSICRVFTSGEAVVEFNPVGPEDEELAMQETDYVNHVATKENDWFNFVWSWTKSALLQNNSYAKVWVEDCKYVTSESYRGLLDSEFAEIVSRENIDVISHEEKVELVPVPTPMGVIQQPISLHDIKVRVTGKERKFRFDVIPQEELKVSKNARSISLRDVSFVEHSSFKTKSELLSDGFESELIDGLGSGDLYASRTGVLEVAREQYEANPIHAIEGSGSEEVMLVHESYVRMDVDGDGYSELRKIISVGDTILENEECDFIPIIALCPNPMPYKHVGSSSVDSIMDLQLISSTLVRMMLNNLYLTNNPEKEVVTANVNMDDILTSAPGNVHQVTEIGSIREITTPFTAGASFPMLELIDRMKFTRTGVSPSTKLDPDVLKQTTKGAYLAGIEQSNQLLETVVRVFAETGFKELFRMLHELIIKNQDKQKVIKLRNKWVTINPSEWKTRTDLTVSVGIGTGNKDQALSQLILLADKQVALKGLGIVTNQNIYNTYKKIIDLSGLKDVSQYFTDPKTVAPAPPPVDPSIELIKGQIENERQLNQIKLREQDMKNQREMEKLRKEQADKISEIAIKLTELELKYGQNIPGALV